MSLKPLHDWAVIVPAEAETRTAGGLFIPDSAKEKPEEGVVEAIGPGAFEEEKRRKKPSEKKERRFIPTVVKPGDHVIYERYAGRTYQLEGEERILVRERDILGILKGKSLLLAGRSKSLQIPASTTQSSSNQIVPVSSQATKASQQVKKTPKAGKKIAKKKSAKKAAIKKAASKPAKKAGRKTSPKKTKRKK